MGIARGFFVACLEDAGGAFSPVVRCKVDLIETLTALGQADENSDKSLLSGPCDATLASFCFPLGASCLPEWRKKPPKEFSFTLTGGMGERLHGFCRVAWSRKKQPQVQPPSASRETRMHCEVPAAADESSPAIVDAGLTCQLLGQAHELMGEVESGASVHLPPRHPLRQRLVGLVEACPKLPAPMESFFVQDTKFRLPGDFGNGHWNCGIPVAAIFTALSPEVVLDVVPAILQERRCLFVSSSLSTLSQTVCAMAAFIYPFRWQHIFLPVVPDGLIDYLQAPMPWIAGLPRQLFHRLSTMELDEVVVINIDAGKIRMSSDAIQAANNLPWRKQMFEQLTKVMEAMDGVGNDPDRETVANVLLASVMRDFFLRVLGSYRFFINSMSEARGVHAGSKGNYYSLKEGNLWFDHDSFVQAQRSGHVRQLLEGMRGSQIYEVFIRERLTQAAGGFQEFNDPFELDVAAIQHEGGLSAKHKMSLPKLQAMPSQIVSHLRAFHHDLKLSNSPSNKDFNLGKMLTSTFASKMDSLAVGNSPLQRISSVETTLRNNKLTQKVAGAGKQVSRAAAVLSGRMRLHSGSCPDIAQQAAEDNPVSGSASLAPDYRRISVNNDDDSTSAGSSRWNPGAAGHDLDSEVESQTDGDSHSDGVNEPSTFDFPFVLPRGRENPISTVSSPSRRSSSSSTAVGNLGEGGIPAREVLATSLENLFDDRPSLGVRHDPLIGQGATVASHPPRLLLGPPPGIRHLGSSPSEPPSALSNGTSDDPFSALAQNSAIKLANSNSGDLLKGSKSVSLLDM